MSATVASWTLKAPDGVAPADAGPPFDVGPPFKGAATCASPTVVPMARSVSATTIFMARNISLDRDAWTKCPYRLDNFCLFMIDRSCHDTESRTAPPRPEDRGRT